MMYINVIWESDEGLQRHVDGFVVVGQVTGTHDALKVFHRCVSLGYACVVSKMLRSSLFLICGFLTLWPSP